MKPHLRVPRAAVRLVGTRKRGTCDRHVNGRIVGWVYEAPDGRYAFTYDTKWLLDSRAYPIDPYRLPLIAGPFYSAGKLKFDGALTLFDLIQPGPFAEGSCFRWLSAFINKVSTAGSGSAAPNFDRPQTPLTRLVWASELKATDRPLFGLYFDAAADYTQWPGMPELPLRGQNLWVSIREEMPPAPEKPNLGLVHFTRMVYNPDDYSPEVARSIVPLPGGSLRIRWDREGTPGTIRICHSESNHRKEIIGCAYLQLAKSCGLPAAEAGATTIGHTMIVWTELIMGGERKSVPRTHDGLYEAGSYLEQLPDTIYPLTLPPVPSIVSFDTQAGMWQVLETTEAARARFDCPITVQVLGIRKVLAGNRCAIERDEAFRRIAFSVMTYVLKPDHSPLLLRPSVDMHGSGLWRNETRWRLAAMTATTPHQVPFKTGTAVAPSLLREVGEVSSLLGVSASVFGDEIRRVQDGVKDWRRISKEVGLNESEEHLYSPLIRLREPSVIDGRTRDRTRSRRVRRQMEVVTDD